MNLEEQRNDDSIIRLAEQEKDPEGPPCHENMEESADEFEHQKKSLAGFLGRVSTWIRNANACVADKIVGDLRSIRKELDVAWERFDSFYENYITKNLPEGELDRVKDRYTEIVVQYEECTIRINDCLTQMKKTNTNTASFPRVDTVQLANDFGNFFALKIDNINASLANLSTSSVPSLPATDITCLKEQLTGFRTLSQEQEVRMLISKAAGKSCQLDPIPTPIVLKLLDVLLPVITKLINLSFDTGRFAEAWKEALVLPSLKKPGLDFAFKNFRPVSNLSYISKLSERAGAEQFLEHLTANNLDSQLQSAYKQQHSTETALLKVKNDILMSIDEQHVTLLIILDLSAAFNTIHRDKLIGRLESDLGITDNVLAWFKSYVSDRFQRVSVNVNPLISFF